MHGICRPLVAKRFFHCQFRVNAKQRKRTKQTRLLTPADSSNRRGMPLSRDMVQVSIPHSGSDEGAHPGLCNPHSHASAT